MRHLSIAATQVRCWRWKSNKGTPRLRSGASGEGHEYWFAQDGLGSIAAVTKHEGQSAHEYFYTPFGGIVDDNGHPEDNSNWTDPHNHYLLTGKEWDEEMELYYFGARYYDAATGVWLTQDVYRGAVEQPLTLHRTLYALANPVNNVDAYGYRVVANGYGDSGGGSTPVHPRDSAPDPARQDNHPYEWKPERDGSGGGGRRGRNRSDGGRRDEFEDEKGYPSYLIHRRGRLECGPDTGSIVAADSTLAAEDEPWWVQMVTDPGWQQVFLESAARHNRPETELTDEEFAATLAAIVRMESDTLGGATVGEDAEARFKQGVSRFLSRYDENTRYQIVVFSKTAEIEYNYAYGHEGLMHQILTVGGSLFGMEGARKGYELGDWISDHLPLTGQSEGLPNISPDNIAELWQGISELDEPTAEQIERLQAEGRLVEQEGRYYLRTGVEVYEYGEDSPVAGETFPAAQGWTTVPGFIMRGHSERIQQDQYIEYQAAHLEAGLVVAQAQSARLDETVELQVPWAEEGTMVEMPRSVQMMATWYHRSIVRRVDEPSRARWQMEEDALAYAGSIGVFYHEVLPYFQETQP